MNFDPADIVIDTSADGLLLFLETVRGVGAQYAIPRADMTLADVIDHIDHALSDPRLNDDEDDGE